VATRDYAMMVDGVILAGGQSRRMGQDKALMVLGGRTLLQRVIDVLAPICAELILVANEPERYARFALKTVSDVFPGAGSLGGLYSGLAASRSESVIAVACDMPFLNASLLGYMEEQSREADAVVPDLSAATLSPGEKPKAKQLDLHPLHAVYRRACLAPIEAQLRAGDLRMMGFFEQVNVRFVKRAEILRLDPQLRSMANLNTPEEWAQAEKFVSDQPPPGS
jgi:molybdopterin-guanine dinucleotide biosynthesis protein A